MFLSHLITIKKKCQYFPFLLSLSPDLVIQLAPFGKQEIFWDTHSFLASLIFADIENERRSKYQTTWSNDHKNWSRNLLASCIFERWEKLGFEALGIRVSRHFPNNNWHRFTPGLVNVIKFDVLLDPNSVADASSSSFFIHLFDVRTEMSTEINKLNTL